MAMNWHESDAGFMTLIQLIKQEVYVNILSTGVKLVKYFKGSSNAMVQLTWLNALKLFPSKQCILTHFTQGKETKAGLCKAILRVLHHHASTGM